MSAPKTNHDDRYRPTADDLAGVTVTIEGPEGVPVRRQTRARTLVSTIVESAVAGNQRLGDTASSAAPVEFEIHGCERLQDLAAHFGTTLETSTKLRNWTVLFGNLASLALCISESVFVRNGPETASEVALHILSEMGFQPRSAIARDDLIAGLLDCLRSTDTPRLAAYLKDSFEPPMIPSTTRAE